MSNWTIRIEYIAGEGPRNRMVRIKKLIDKEKRDKGAQQITMSRNISEISEALAETGRDQNVVLSDEERGSIARRSPTINLAANTGVKELDNYINKTLPDMKMLETYSSPRQRALSLALPSAVGVPRELRVPNIEAEDRLMAANILGSLPSGGMSLEESARNKLAATVKQALGDLGVGGSEVRSMLRDRLASRPFFNDPALIGNFANMIKAYHDIREYNLHYAQALVPGLKAVKDPQRLTGALLPTPDSILNGTTAYLIYNYGEAPTITDFKGYVREALMKLLNLGPAPKGLTATTKQLQVGKLLSEFDFNRKKAAKALMKAVDQAMSRGGDFASSYAELQHKPTGTNAEINDALDNLEQRFNDTLASYKEAIDFDKSILSYVPAGGAGANLNANDRAFFDFLVKEQVIFEVSENFFLIPVVLPSFDVNPVGWDRRWMIATMKIMDEYWDMIYNEDRKILLQDLLFLIATRTKELFNYDIDVVQMTILTLLITPESPVARRRARSILPKNAGGEVPLRSLTQLIKSSTKDEEQRGQPVQEEDRVVELENELNLMKVGDETERADLKHIQKGIRRVVSDLKSYGGDIQREHFVNDPAKVNAFMPRLKAIFDPLDAAIDKAENGANLAEAGAEAIKTLLGDFEAKKDYGNWDSKDLVESRKKLVALLPYSKTKMTDIGADLDKLIGYATELGLKIEKQKEDAPGSGTLVDRDAGEVAGDIYDRRKSVRARRRGRTRSKTTGMKEIGFVTAEVVVGTNVFKDVGMGIRDLVGGRSTRLEEMVNESLKLLVAELYERAESMGGDYVGDIAIQPIVYGGATMLTLIAHGVAYDTGGKKVKSNPPEAEMIEEGEWTDFPTYGPSAYRMDYTTSGTSVKPSPIRGNSGGLLQIIRERRPRLAGGETGYGTIVLEEWAQKTANMLGRPISAMIEFDAPGVEVQDGTQPMVTEIGSLYWTNDVDGPSPGELNKLYSNQSEFIWGNELLKTFLPSGMKANPVETGRTDSYDTYTLAKSAAVAQANKEGETVYLWREGGKVKVSMFFPGKIDPREVTAIQPNPPRKASANFPWSVRNADEAFELLRKHSPYAHILDRDEMNRVMDEHSTGFLMFGSNGFYPGSDFTFKEYAAYSGEEDIDTVEKYITKYGRDGEVAVYDFETGKWFPFGTTGLSLKPSRQARKKSSSKKPTERKYKGMIISKVDDGWEVDAYGKVFKTLEAARDFISKKVKGTAAPNQQCVRIIAGTRCVGTIVKLNQGGHYQCKKCKAKYRAV